MSNSTGSQGNRDE